METYIQIPNGRLDLKSNLPFSIEMSIADIRKIEKKNTSRSKSIKIPGTQNNIKLLGNLADINSDFSFFNPNFKTDMKLVTKAGIMMDGYLKLVSIDKYYNNDQKIDEVYFNIELNQKSADLMSIIDKKLLTDLDFSEYDHILSKSKILEGFTHSVSDGYCYINTYNNGLDEYECSDFKPAIFYKEYLTKIIEGASFSVGGSFLDNSTFKKEIIPFTGSVRTLTSAEISERKFRASISGTQSIVPSDTVIKGGLQSVTEGYPTISSQLTFDKIVELSDDSTSPNFDNNSNFNTSTFKFKPTKNGSYNLDSYITSVITFKSFKDDINLIKRSGSNITITFDTPHNFHTQMTYLEWQLKDTTNFNGTGTQITYIDSTSIRLSGFPTGSNEFSGTFCYKSYQKTYKIDGYGNENQINLNDPYYFYLRSNLIQNNNVINSSNVSSFGQIYPKNLGNNPTFDSSNSWTSTINNSLAVSKTNLNVTTIDEFWLKFNMINGANALKYIKYDNKSTNYNTHPVPIYISIEVINSGNGTYMKNEVNGSKIVAGDMIYMNSYLPKKIKQKDLINDLKNRYNLIFNLDPDNEKKIIIDTRNDYYNYNSSDSLDWSKKKNLKFKDNIKLLTDLQNKEILLTYKNDSDIWNKNWTLRTGGEKDGDIYGQKTIKFDNEFKKGTKKIETPFSPTPLDYNSLNKTMIVPAIFTNDSKMNIRVLMHGGKINVLNGTWNLGDYRNVAGTLQNVSSYTYYGYGGHLDHPLNPSENINFGDVSEYYHSETVSDTTNNLYNRYWKDYMSQIATGKLLTTSIYLNNSDINFIKDNMNVKIHLNNGEYYFINKINNYNPLNDEPTTVELIKIDDGITYIPEIVEKPTTLNPSEQPRSLVISKSTSKNDNSSNNSNSNRIVMSGSNNYIGYKNNGTLISGNNNRIGDSVINSGILGGDNNLIYGFVENSYIIGSNNRVITQSNEFWVGDLHIIDGKIQIDDINLINGPQNSLFNIFDNSVFDLVNGPQNSLRNLGSDSEINLIRGDTL